MGNLMTPIKRFVGNKNSVTIIGVVASILVLYFGYTYRVKSAIDPIAVPAARALIVGNTKVTQDMVDSVSLPSSVVNSSADLIKSPGEIIGKYVRYDAIVPEGGFFYRTLMMTEEELPNSATRDIPEGYTVYPLKVDLHTTYGNSIMPDDYIDLYFKAVDDNSFILFGKFIESIKVLAVKDNAGNHVFSSASGATPSELVFAVPDEYFKLLKKTDYIGTNSIEIIPVPRNKDYSENPGDTKITSNEIKSFINAKAIDAAQTSGTDIIQNVDE